MTNKKIMLVATTDNMIWQFLIPHIKHLEEFGNTIECVCAKTGFWFDELQNKYGFTMHEMDFARNPIKPKNIKSYKALKKLQEERKFDLVYCQQPVGGLMGRLIGKKFKLTASISTKTAHLLILLFTKLLKNGFLNIQMHSLLSTKKTTKLPKT